MKYTFDPKTDVVSNEDGSVAVWIRGVSREGVWSFVLCLRNKRFGFESGETGSEDEVSQTSDGTAVWRIQCICVSLSDVYFPKHGERHYSNATCFADIAEQDEALRVFAEALAIYDSDPQASAAGLAKARVEYGKNVLRGIESGAYLA